MRNRAGESKVTVDRGRVTCLPDVVRPDGKEAKTMTNLRRLAVYVFAGALAAWVGVGRPIAQTAESPPLELVAKIQLRDVAGRIDHLAVDLSRQRLFVAELGNDSVAVVDLKAGKV